MDRTRCSSGSAASGRGHRRHAVCFANGSQPVALRLHGGLSGLAFLGRCCTGHKPSAGVPGVDRGSSAAKLGGGVRGHAHRRESFAKVTASAMAQALEGARRWTLEAGSHDRSQRWQHAGEKALAAGGPKHDVHGAGVTGKGCKGLQATVLGRIQLLSSSMPTTGPNSRQLLQHSCAWQLMGTCS